MNYEAAEQAALAVGLAILGGFHRQEEAETLLLFGPAADFWDRFSRQPEAVDGLPNPIDRWSQRTLDTLASQLKANVFLPFTGPPYAPFLSWALKSGRCWSSPVGMLVHDRAGLMVSFRGALVFDSALEMPVPPLQSPCETCVEQPCRSACPVSALGADGYDTVACHGFLDSPAGASCLSQGCAARRACPVSLKRPDAQSAHHMRYFHKG